MTDNRETAITQTWFNACPIGLMILDHDGRVSAINPALGEIINCAPEALVGRREEEVSTSELRGLFAPDGELQLLSRGIPDRQLKVQSREMPGKDGFTLRSYFDISEYHSMKQENARLTQQVEELTLTDDLTGLANERAFHRVLGAQVTRSRRYTNPLCLAVVEIEAKASSEEISKQIILAVGHYLRDRLRWVDLIARWSGDRFMLILPETTAEDGHRLLNKVKQDFVEARLPEELAHLVIRLQIGLAQWQKGNDARILINRSMEALAEAKKADEATADLTP
ncbi:MAG: sensor domain-containing diguanylate cyclase [Gammaproteobacteria bacterium]